MSEQTINAATSTLAINGELTIFTAGTQRDALAAVMAEGLAVDIDLSQVTDIDTAGVQLLLAARREAASHQQCLRLTQVSDAVRETIAMYRLTAALGLTE